MKVKNGMRLSDSASVIGNGRNLLLVTINVEFQVIHRN